MMIDPKRAMRDYQKAVEKYQVYERECKAKGEEILPFEVWEKKAIDEAWTEGLKLAGCTVIDTGSVKFVVWPDKKKEKAEKAEEEQAGQY